MPACARIFVPVASIHRLAVEEQEPGKFEAYNVGTGVGVSVLEVVEAARKVTGHGIPAQFPRLAGQYADLNGGWLKAYASGARPSVVMSPIASRLSENDIKAVSEYAAGLR